MSHFVEEVSTQIRPGRIDHVVDDLVHHCADQISGVGFVEFVRSAMGAAAAITENRLVSDTSPISMDTGDES